MTKFPIVDLSEHRPRRGDEVDVWLRARRVGYQPGSTEWTVIDDVIDDYRRRADYGLSLLDESDESTVDAVQHSRSLAERILHWLGWTPYQHHQRKQEEVI